MPFQPAHGMASLNPRGSTPTRALLSSAPRALAPQAQRPNAVAPNVARMLCAQIRTASRAISSRHGNAHVDTGKPTWQKWQYLSCSFLSLPRGSPWAEAGPPTSGSRLRLHSFSRSAHFARLFVLAGMAKASGAGCCCEGTDASPGAGGGGGGGGGTAASVEAAPDFPASRSDWRPAAVALPLACGAGGREEREPCHRAPSTVGMIAARTMATAAAHAGNKLSGREAASALMRPARY